MTGIKTATGLSRETIGGSCLLVLAVFLAYMNVYHNPPLLDDKNLIVHNDHLHSLNGMLHGAMDPAGFYRPMQMLFYFFIYQVFGLSLPAFHALNVILQAVNAVLVFRLGCRLGFKPAAAFFGALLWAVHPLHTDDVTMMCATAAPLSCFFMLTGILVLLPDFSVRKLWLSGLLFLCALASKQSAVVFPALATSCLFLVSKDRLRLSTYYRTWPLWGMAAVFIAGSMIYYSINTNLVLSDPDDTLWVQLYMHNVFNRILTCLAAVPVYARLLLWPSRLHVDYDLVISTAFTGQVLAGLLIAVAVLAQIFYARGRRALPLSWGLLWFIAAQSPNTGILVPLNGVMAEGWMYVPSIGLFLGAAQTAALWLDKLKTKRLPEAACGLALLIALSLGIKTHTQNEIWGDEMTFFENTLANGSHSGRGHVILAMLDAYQGRFDEAIAHEQAALSHPSPLHLRETPGLHFDLALMYLHARPENTETGIITTEEAKRALSPASQLPEAIAELKKVQELDPAMSALAGQFLDVIHAYQQQQDPAFAYEAWAEKKVRQGDKVR
jgi:hypothetical protein